MKVPPGLVRFAPAAQVTRHSGEMPTASARRQMTADHPDSAVVAFSLRGEKGDHGARWGRRLEERGREEEAATVVGMVMARWKHSAGGGGRKLVSRWPRIVSGALLGVLRLISKCA